MTKLPAHFIAGRPRPGVERRATIHRDRAGPCGGGLMETDFRVLIDLISFVFQLSVELVQDLQDILESPNFAPEPDDFPTPGADGGRAVVQEVTTIDLPSVRISEEYRL